MIRTTQYGKVTRFDLSRDIYGIRRYWTTAYLVDNWMIDTGCAHTARELLRLLADQKIDGIINTHSHEDHIGANFHLQQRNPDLQIYAHPASIKILESPEEYQPLHPYRHIFWGQVGSSCAEPFGSGSLVATENYRFQVIYTPGHTSDHVCLYEPDEKWLFTGDLYVGGKDRALRAGCDIWQVIESLEKVADLPAVRMFPSSARVRENPAKHLREKADYLVHTGQEVLDMQKEGANVQQIARSLFGGPMLIELITLGHFTRRRLVLSYLNQNYD